MAVKTKGKTEETKRPTLRSEEMHAEQSQGSQVAVALVDLWLVVGDSADIEEEE